ncbi:MAG: hypothetical protein M3T96_07885 [Acidobacteriota bacterium]|nr:hypothetical protein [Acidobacteriota bacterium]
MCCKGFTKRILPFFLTFAVGLFIASFFVSVSAPRFQFSNCNSRRNHRQYDREREMEVQRLRDENLRLKDQLPQDTEEADYQNLQFSAPASSVPTKGKLIYRDIER